MGMSIESVAHLNPNSPVMGNANAGAGGEEGGGEEAVN